jgi:hypothetical protein
MRVAGQPHTRCRSVTSTHHVVQRVLGDRGYAPAKLTRTVAGGCAAGWCGRGVAREPPTPGTRVGGGLERRAWRGRGQQPVTRILPSSLPMPGPVTCPWACLTLVWWAPWGSNSQPAETSKGAQRDGNRARLRLQQLELGRTWRPVSDGILPSILPKPGLLAAGRERHRTDNQPRPGARRRSGRPDRGAGHELDRAPEPRG